MPDKRENPEYEPKIRVLRFRGGEGDEVNLVLIFH